MKTATETFDVIESHRKAIEGGKTKVSPGNPASFDGAAEGDPIAQGDLYIRLCKKNEKPPSGYIKIKSPSGLDLKLVPGGEDGAKHHLDSGDGVVLFRPPQWGKDESLAGPWLVVTKDRTILHTGNGHHGPVMLRAGDTYECAYQRVWESERRAEMRARD